MSTIQTPGRTPRKRVLLFALGTNPTDKYGDVEVDHADLIQAMHYYQRRGVALPIDVEHATQLPSGKPAAWQDSHGWAGLEVDHQGLHALIDYNENGAAKLKAREVAYDSPAIHLWRGNHLAAVEMLSLVKDPARNGSIPLCMSNATAAPAQPSVKVKTLQRLHGAFGELIAAMGAGKSEQELNELNESLSKVLVEPMAKVNELLQQAGAATLAEERPAEGADTPDKPAETPKLLSGRPDPLAELGAEVLSSLGVKTIDEARGKLQALKDNTTTLMSGSKTETKLLLLTGLLESKVSPDEVQQYQGETPEFVTALLSNRIARVNTRPAAGQQTTDTASDAGVDKAFVGGVADMLKRTTGVSV